MIPTFVKYGLVIFLIVAEGFALLGWALKAYIVFIGPECGP